MKTAFNIGHLPEHVNPELRVVVQEVLKLHVGRSNTVSRQELCHFVSLYPGVGGKNLDRRVRAAINEMRKDGEPICSTGGINGGYFIASSHEELDEYLEAELRSRAIDLLEQYHAMQDGARRYFADKDKQLALF